MASPCVPVPIPAPPTLPLPFNITPAALPTPPALGANLCCVPINLGVTLPPLPLPPLVVNPGVVAALRQGIAAIQSFISSLPIDCPRN